MQMVEGDGPELKKQGNNMSDWKYQVVQNPKEDITTWELARCIPYMFSKLHEIAEWDKLEEDITRHFSVSRYNYTEMIKHAANKLKEIWDE